MTLIKTDDYDKFVIPIYNRNISAKHVNRIYRSFIENGPRLDLSPIIVNEHMEIVDGQHRFMAAQKLGIPITYRVVEDSGEDDFVLVNSINKSLRTADYLNYYLKKGHKKMVRLGEIADELEMSYDLIFYFMAGVNKFTPKRLEEIEPDANLEEFKECVQSLKRITELLERLPLDVPKPFITSTKFKTALFKFIWDNSILFDEESFVNKIKRYNHLIMHKASKSMCIQMFKNIYNHGRKTCRIE